MAGKNGGAPNWAITISEVAGYSQSMNLALSQDENKLLQETSSISRINSKRAVPTILSDTNVAGNHSLQSLNSSEKRYHSFANNVINMTPSIQSNGSNHSVKTPLLPANSSSKTLKHISSTRSSGTLLFTSNRKLSSRKHSLSVDKAPESSATIAIDNSIKTSVTFLFDPCISYQTISLICMAIRRSQVGFYSNLSLSKPLSRGNLTSSGLTHFIEGVIDAYQTFITSHYDDSYFYLKGPSFSVMFTHDPEGNSVCYGSFPSEMITQLQNEDVRFTRMKDEDEDEIAEEDLFSYRTNSRLIPSGSSLHQPDHVNVGVTVHDGLSILKMVNFIINYSVHLGETQMMTQIISSFPFAHSAWVMYSPVYKKNVLHRNAKGSSLSIFGVVTKKQLQLLCSIVNSIFEKCGLSGMYTVNLSTERYSQLFNPKNSTSTIEGKVLQTIQCTIKNENHSISYVNTTKSVI